MEEQTKGGWHPGRAEVGWLVVVAQWAPATRPVRRRTGPTAWSSGPGLGAEDATIGVRLVHGGQHDNDLFRISCIGCASSGPNAECRVPVPLPGLISGVARPPAG